MKAKKWTVVSPVTVSISADTPFFLDECCGEEQESFDLDMSQSANLVNSSDSLSSFLANMEKEDLREHYEEDRNIYKIVFGDSRITEDCDRIIALTYVYTSPELQELPQSVLDFISGQLSDGWGEGKEQEEVKLCTYYRNTQNFSVESGEMEEEEEGPYSVYAYVHFWQPDNFYLNVEELPEYADILDEKEILRNAIKEEMASVLEKMFEKYGL